MTKTMDELCVNTIVHLGSDVAGGLAKLQQVVTAVKDRCGAAR
jgi:hypothetical protein